MREDRTKKRLDADVKVRNRPGLDGEHTARVLSFHMPAPSGELADNEFLGQACANAFRRADRKIAEHQPDTTIGLGVVKVREGR